MLLEDMDDLFDGLVLLHVSEVEIAPSLAIALDSKWLLPKLLGLHFQEFTVSLPTAATSTPSIVCCV